jgi:hypothetical protein
MKLGLIAAGGAAILFSVSGIAYSQVAQPAPGADQPSMQQQAATPAATEGQVADQSMGGMSMSSRTDSGRSALGTPCVIGLSCDIYKGN